MCKKVCCTCKVVVFFFWRSCWRRRLLKLPIKGSAPPRKESNSHNYCIFQPSPGWCLWSQELGEGIWMARDLYCYVKDNSNLHFSFHFKVIICCISTLTPHNKLYFLRKWVKSQMRYYIFPCSLVQTTSWVPRNCFVQEAKPFFSSWKIFSKTSL